MAPPDQGKVTWGFHIKSSLHMYRYTFAFPPFQTGSTDVHPLPPPWGLRPPTALLPYLIAPPSQTLSVPISHWPFPMDKRALCQLIPEMVLGRQRNSGDLSIAAFMCVHVSGRWSPSYVALDGLRGSCRQRWHMRSGRAAVVTFKGVQDSFICFRWGNIRPKMSILVHLTAFKWLMWSQIDGWQEKQDTPTLKCWPTNGSLSVCQNVNNSIDNCSNLTHSRIKYDTRVKECLFEHFQACWQNVYYHLISETSQVSHLSWCNRFFKHTHVYAVSQEQCGNYGLPL